MLCLMLTAGSFNLCDAQHVIRLFNEAADANLATPGRSGSVVDLPKKGRLLLTGDIHDHRDNYQKILKLAELDKSDDHYVLLHELVHGEHLINNMDLSYRLLAQAAVLKIERPHQVQFVLANHELAQVNTEGILKNGKSQVECFSNGLYYLFGETGLEIEGAIGRFITTMPLAIRCANGVMACHSLPSQRMMPRFDRTVLDRELSETDLKGPAGSAHMMVWGRNQPQALADELAAEWGVKQFVMGHQKAEMGYEEFGDTMLVLNSHHSHGAVLPMELSKKYNRDKLVDEVLPLAGVII